MSLKAMLTSKWFTRLVLVSWMACAVAIYFVFKNMEYIVHGQLYNFGLIPSPEWADPYRVLTWTIFVCLGLPTVLSGIALASSFLGVEEPKNIVPQRTKPQLGVTKVGHTGSQRARPVQQAPPAQQTRQVQEPVAETVSKFENDNCVGISCPKCKKIFGRALVMLDFRGGSNRMVSVCPYCNSVLGYTTEEKLKNGGLHGVSPEKRAMQ
jgi:hypothetical protein